jgi:glycosyltransferase involved in cell wall biosynthesis
MKIALIYMHPFSESMGSFVRIRELSSSLEKQGIETYILTPYERTFDLSRNIHVISMSNLINTLFLSKLSYKLTKFVYYNKIFPKIFSKNYLLIDKFMARVVKETANFICKKAVDLIQVEQDAVLPLGVGLKRETGLPLVADVHNITSEELVAAGILVKSSDQFCALQRKTKEYLSQTDKVVVVSESMKNYVTENYGLNSGNVHVVPPGGKIGAGEELIAKRDKIPKMVYAGLVTYREHVDLFVRSMPAVKKYDETAKFYITNKGGGLKDIKKLANQLGVKPTFFWYDNYESVDNFLLTCHVGILPSSNDIARRMGTPAKLFNYLSAGLPVVANDIGGWTEIIKRERVGIVTPDTWEGFAEGLITVIKNPSMMKEYAINSLELIKSKYNWNNSASVLLDSYDELTGCTSKH